MNVSNWQYELFGQWLAQTSLNRVTLGFAEIEAIIGAELPSSALTHNAWWSNSTSHPLARVWLGAGWRVPEEGLQWSRKEITLVRVGPKQSEHHATGPDYHPSQGAIVDVVEPSVPIPVPEDWHDLLADARHICIEPERRADGTVRHFQPQNDYAGRDDVALNRYGSGSFCRFRVPRNINKAGVYLIVANDTLAYVGECQDFSQRFNMGYGQISPRNCYVGGQETNCRVNQLILKCVEAGRTVAAYFIETPHRAALESALVQTYGPPWNR
jgi:hypothetical protein